MELDMRLINVALPLLDSGQLYEVGIAAGKWSYVRPQEQISAERAVVPLEELDPGRRSEGAAVDLRGRLLLPGLVDSHMHLDKAFTIQSVGNRSGTLREAIDNYSAAAPGFTKEQIKTRMREAVRQAAAYGTTSIRSHLDFNCREGIDVAMRTVYAALELKEEMKDVMELQFFPMCPYDPGSGPVAEAYEEALRLGLDGVGGAPHLSADPEGSIAQLFRLADKLDMPIDLHADENDDPNVRTVELIAEQTLRYGYQGRVAAGHLCSLSAMDQATAEGIMRKMADAGLRAITLPGANMYLQGRGDRGLVRRGVTRVKELAEAGVPVAVASDNIQDPFHPFGRGDLLQIGLLSAYASHLASEQELLMLLRMMTDIPAAILGLTDYGVRPGRQADFVIFDARTVNDVLSWLPAGRWVGRKGEWISVNRELSWRREV
ncbi:amidohydrolase family protein [Paenibacillus sp. 1P07SE]|uniref:amidohydrolase family protein n=1 Tax=Paenibacillus sp. 1P07SE TaxID=3132209 RepID=UPI0039A43649